MSSTFRKDPIAPKRELNWQQVLKDLLWQTPEVGNSTVLRDRLKKIVYIRVLVLSVLLGMTAINVWQMESTGSDAALMYSLLWPIGLTYAVSVVNLILLKYEQNLIRFSYLQLSVDVFLSTFSLYLIGTSGSIFLYLLVIVAAAAILGSHGALRIAALCGICFGLLASGFFPPLNGEPIATQTQDFLVVYTALVAVALIAGWTSKQFEMVGLLADKRAKDLSELTNRQAQLFEDLSEGIITIDMESAITSINQAASAIMGLSQIDSRDYLGKPLPSILTNQGVKGIEKLLSGDVTENTPSEITLHDAENDKEVCLSYLARPLTDSQGEVTGRMFIFRDVSHVKNMEEQLSLHEKMTALLAEERALNNPQDPTEHKSHVFMVGDSPVMDRVFNLIERVGPSDASVLISGESGTGKELIAKAIHSSSSRESRPFVAINCGAIPENLIESELFGHVKGAFTGAVRDNNGLFREAEGGTIFLDEVGELPLHLQSKLLRVLQERYVRAVGGVHDIPVDVRVIAASNRNLKKEVAADSFREDLFYRLNVVNIVVPPLRDRREDIPLLVKHFISRFSLPDEPLPRISPEALQALMNYDFPGNVRELENIIERALVLGGHAILAEHLPEDARLSSTKEVITTPSRGHLRAVSETEVTILPINLESELARIERSYLMRALEESGGVKKQAAELLGLNFRSFRYRLKKYEMSEKAE